jgi:uncharacterized membrane protein
MACRIVYTGSFLFTFLVWNLFLAFVPYFLARQIGRLRKNKWTFFGGVFVWLLFVPNAFYILTDLFHLDMNEAVPLWYDLALLLSFAWNGLLFGILSIRLMEKQFEQYFSRKFDLVFIVPVMALNGLGVYIGRYLRFNSWDIVIKPLQLTQDMAYLFVHPLRNRFDWSMIVCYTVLMTLIYLTIKKLSKVL